MGDNVPTVFEGGGDLVVQFSYPEFATNIGYVRFYGCQEEDSGGAGYFLTTQTLDSARPYTSGQATLNYDFEFRKPTVVAADDAFLNFTFYAPATPTTSVFVITIYHVDGVSAAATSIGTVTTPTRSPVAIEYFRECVKIALTQTNFKIGDKIRMAVNTAGIDVNAYYYHDPTTSLTVTDIWARTVGTDLTVDIPFKIQI